MCRALALIFLLLLGSAHAARLEVEVRGVSDEMRENVRLKLGVVDLAGRDDVAPATLEFYLQSVSDEVAEALQPFGYYAATAKVRTERKGERTRVIVEVTPGDPVRVRSVATSFLREGEYVVPDFPPPPFPLFIGERLDHRRYEFGKRTITNWLLNEGYIEAEPVIHRVEVYPEAYAADIELQYELGPRHHFGDIRFEGSQFDDAFMQRYAGFVKGEYFSQLDLLAMNQRLIDSGYFATVDVSAQIDQLEDLHIPVLVRVTPNARDSYEGGISYGTDSGGGLELSWQRRWVNDEAHRSNLVLALGQRKQVISETYDIPNGDTPDAFVQLTAAYIDEETDTNTSETTTLGASRFRPWRGWRRTDSLNYLREDSLIGDTTQVSSDFLLPGFALSRTVGADSLIPENGYAIRGSIRGGAEALLSDTSLVQLDLAGKVIISLGDHWRLLNRARIAGTWVEDFSELPASLRFFAGGDRSIRGFAFEALGPVNALGEVVGGQHLAEFSVEAERVITGPWRAAAFVDFGNAFSGSDFEVAVGAGLGARYASPVGLIKVDVAVPLRPDDGDHGVRLHIAVGPEL